MKSSIKVRSRNAAAVTPRVEAQVEDGPGVNDNVPARLPGHELSDLEGVPRQPAGEPVIYYNRVTLIESFPAHPKQAPDRAADVPAMEAKREAKASIAKPSRRRVAIACVFSFLFHAAVFAALVTTFVVTSEEAQEDAGEVVSVIMLGSDADEQAAGEESKEPEQVVADAVQPDTVQPTDAKPEPVQPVEQQPTEVQPTDTAQAMQPTEAQQTQPEEVQPAKPDVSQVTPEPEVMTSTVPSESTVVQPMAAQVPESVQQPEAEPPQPAEVQPSTQPVEAAEVQPEPQVPEQVVTPVEKPPFPKRPAEKPKVVAKKEPPKPVKVKSGSNGQGQIDTHRGAADGQESARQGDNAQALAQRSGSGGASESNYLGKVRSSINRCVQRLPNGLRKADVTVRIGLTVDGGGNLLSVRAASGVPELDEAVAGLVRGCSVPPLPAEIGRTKSVIIPLQVRQ